MLKAIQAGESPVISEIITLEMPFLVPAASGILLAFLVPLIGIIFCCCRCCGNCGGNVRAHDIMRQTKKDKYMTGILLVIVLGFLGAMAVCIPMSGQRMLDSPPYVFDSLDASLHDIQEYISHFVQDMFVFVSDELDSILGSVKQDLQELPTLLSEPLTNSTSGYMDIVKSAANSITEVVDSLPSLETQMNATIDAIKLHVNNLNNGINTLNANLINLKTYCQGEGELFCNKIVSGTISNIDVDTSELTDMAGQLSDIVSETASLNLTEYLTLADETFDSLPSTINDSSHSAASSVIDILDTIPDKVLPMINDSINMLDQIPGLSPENMTFIADLEQEVTNVTDFVFPILSKVMFVLCGILLLITVVAAVGLLMGFLCVQGSDNQMRHGRNGCSSCGARLLMCSCGLGVIFVFYFCVLGAILLLLGTNLTVLCRPLQDLTVFDELYGAGGLMAPENGTFLGNLIFNGSDFNLSISSILQQCEAGSTAYSAMSLSSFLNLSSMFNVSEFVPDFGNTLNSQINSTIQNISIMNQTKLDEMQAQLSFPVVNSTNLIQPIQDELASIDLAAVLQDLDSSAAEIPSQTYKDGLHIFAQQLADVLDQNPLPNLKQNVDDLGGYLNTMSSHGNTIEGNFTSLSDNIKALQTFIENTATSTVVQAIDDFVDSMKLVPDTFIQQVEVKLSTDIGKCKVVSDIYKTVVGSVCTRFLDSFNVFWASIYVGAYVMIIVMIFSVNMAKYFRQPSDGNHLDRSRNASSNSPPLWHLDLHKYEINPSTGSASPPKQRGKFHTGSDSPQLLAVRSLAGHLHSSRVCSVCEDFQQKTEGAEELINIGDSVESSFGNTQSEYLSNMAPSQENSSTCSTPDSTGIFSEPAIAFFPPEITECAIVTLPEIERNSTVAKSDTATVPTFPSAEIACIANAPEITVNVNGSDFPSCKILGRLNSPEHAGVDSFNTPETATSVTVAEVHSMHSTPEISATVATQQENLTSYTIADACDDGAPELTSSPGILDITSSCGPPPMDDTTNSLANSENSGNYNYLANSSICLPAEADEMKSVNCGVFQIGKQAEYPKADCPSVTKPMADFHIEHPDNNNNPSADPSYNYIPESNDIQLAETDDVKPVRPVSCAVYEIGEQAANSKHHSVGTPRASSRAEHPDLCLTPCEHLEEVRKSVLQRKRPLTKSDISLPLSRENTLDQVHHSYRTTFIDVCPIEPIENTGIVDSDNNQNNCNAFFINKSSSAMQIKENRQMNMFANNSDAVPVYGVSVMKTTQPVFSDDVEVEIGETDKDVEANVSMQSLKKLDLSLLPAFIVEMDAVSPEFSRDLETMQETLRIEVENSPDNDDIFSGSVCSQETEESDADELTPYMVMKSPTVNECMTNNNEFCEQSLDSVNDIPVLDSNTYIGSQIDSNDVPDMHTNSFLMSTPKVNKFASRTEDIQQFEDGDGADLPDEENDSFEKNTEKYMGERKLEEQYEVLPESDVQYNNVKQEENTMNKDVTFSMKEDKFNFRVIHHSPTEIYHSSNIDHYHSGILEKRVDKLPTIYEGGSTSSPAVRENFMQFGSHVVPRTPAGTDPDLFKSRNFKDFNTSDKSVGSFDIPADNIKCIDEDNKSLEDGIQSGIDQVHGIKSLQSLSSSACRQTFSTFGSGATNWWMEMDADDSRCTGEKRDDICNDSVDENEIITSL